MYQTPFKIKAEAIQLISDIAELQALCGGKGEKQASFKALLREYLPDKFRQGYGTGRLPFLMQDLLGWLDSSSDHILIKGGEFLYELEINQPFDEDNGAIGLKCMLAILGTWNTVFLNLPIEEVLAENQSQYRYALRAAGDSGDAGVFITFMLHIILAALEKCGKNARLVAGVKGSSGADDLINDLLKAVAETPGATYDELAAKLGVSPATIKRRLTDLKKAGKIERVGARKVGSWKVIG